MRLRFSDTSGSAQTAAVTDADEPTASDGTAVRPTFTPVVSGDAVPGQVIPDDVAAQTPTVVEPATPGADYPDDTTYTADADDAHDAADGDYDATDETDQAVEPAAAGAGALYPGYPVTGTDLDQPLLSGDTELLSQWQRVQAEFVDDPQVAVAGAADLVEQAGQALVDALRQRQRQMRGSWDRSGTSGTGAPGNAGADTEQLRQMMQRYRALFHQLCPPAARS
jgi:hypothetical protein